MGAGYSSLSNLQPLPTCLPATKYAWWVSGIRLSIFLSHGDAFYDAFQRFFSLMPHSLYESIVPTFEFNSYPNHSFVALIMWQIAVGLLSLSPDTY